MSKPNENAMSAKLLPSHAMIGSEAVPAFKLLSPGGDEIYKIHARYPTLPKSRSCKILVIWNGGPADRDVELFLIDKKNWVVVAAIARLPNVAAGSIGEFQWQIPDDFQPTDDHLPGDATNAGLYQVYIQDSERTTWTYGPLFTIVWSE